MFSFISEVKYIFFRKTPLNLEVVIDAPFLLLPKYSLYFLYLNTHYIDYNSHWN